VSGLQAIVLLCFNNGDHKTYKQLLEETGLSEKELNVQIISLATLEHKVLLIASPTENINLAKSTSMLNESNSENIQEIDTTLKKSLSTSK
jgi:hypothetical protein